MNKEDFLVNLRNGLSGMPQHDIDERVSFYSEMIDDRVEEGMSEEDAVAGIGPVDEIVSQTITDVPLSKLVKNRIVPKRSLQTWEIVLIVLGFPLWFPLLIAALAVVLSLYLVVWSLIITLWSVWASVVASVASGFIVGTVCFAQGKMAFGLLALGVSSFLAGVSILGFFGCTAASRGVIRLTKNAAVWMKKRFIRKENA